MKKRIGAFLCALLLVFNLATTAPRARAVSAALAAAGVGVVLGAALAAAGIYPYKAAESFGEWTSDKLSSLWSQFCESTEGIAAGATVAMYTSGGLKGYLMNSTIIMPYAVYNVVAAFTSWVASHFALTDNQTGVELGVYEGGLLKVPGLPNGSNSTWFAGNSAYGVSNSSGDLYYYCPLYTWAYAGKTVSPATGENLYVLVRPDFQFNGFYGLKSYYDSPHNVSPTSTATRYNFTYNGQGYVYYAVTFYASNIVSPAGDVPYYESLDQFGRAVLGLEDVSEFSGVTADTGSVEPLAPLAEGTEYGGLAVAGATPMETPADIIEQGVTDREKPVVRPVEVDLEGVEMDTETGELTENPVVVTPDVAIPGIQDLTVPQTFLDKLETAMRTKFPFCLPFDFMRFITALNMTPEAPRFSLTFHDPFTDTDYTITVDLSPWDGVAALVRQLESVLLLLGFWFNFDKFNLLNIILGQLG